MDIAFYNIYNELNDENRIFGSGQSPIGDDLLKPFVQLKEIAKSRHIQCRVFKGRDDSNVNRMIFLDLPKPYDPVLNYAIKNKIPSDLILFECRLIRPTNWILKRHEPFKRVFTWNDELVDNKKYFKLNFSHELKMHAQLKTFSQRKFCHMLTSNKGSWRSGELYSERLNTAKWFEKSAPELFDLYGQSWDVLMFQGLPSLANPIMRRLKLKNPYQLRSYKGAVDRKRDVINNYKFAICYENSRIESGYISEKMLDCLLNGCVPVYWGAPNVDSHIPSDCYIDRRKFKTHEDLADYMLNFTEADYDRFLTATKAFIAGPKGRPFSIQYFIDQVLTGFP